MAEKRVRMNNQIRSSIVMVIDDNGNNLGEMETKKAIYQAKNIGLDLIEVGNKLGVPVCKFVDYGKMKYEQAKKNKKNKQVKQLTKEIKMRPNTSDNDLSYRCKHAKEFLKDGHNVKLTVRFRGREHAHMLETGKDILERFIASLDCSFNHSEANIEGHNISITLSPIRGE